MDKENIKDNILRECYYNRRSNGLGKHELRNCITSDPLLDKCCDELVADGYMTLYDYKYKLTKKGEEFVLTQSFSVPDMPIIQK